MQQRLTSNILRLTALLAQALERSPWGTFRFVSGNPNLYSRLEKGISFNISTYDEVVQSFSTLWPAGLAWPEDIERPDPQLINVEPAVAEKQQAAE